LPILEGQLRLAQLLFIVKQGRVGVGVGAGVEAGVGEELVLEDQSDNELSGVTKAISNAICFSLYHLLIPFSAYLFF
jgi:hypothetical protein